MSAGASERDPAHPERVAQLRGGRREELTPSRQIDLAPAPRVSYSLQKFNTAGVRSSASIILPLVVDAASPIAFSSSLYFSGFIHSSSSSYAHRQIA